MQLDIFIQKVIVLFIFIGYTMSMATLRCSPRECDVLACIELDADKSTESIAKRLGIRTHTVRYILRNLRERGVFQPSIFVDIHTIDRRYCGIFLSVHGSSSSKNRFLNLIRNHPCVGWCAELAGPFEFGIALAVKTPKEVDDILSDLIEKSRVRILAKATSFRLHLTDLPRGYLSSKAIATQALDMVDGAAQVELDALDLKILRAIAAHPWESHRSIARIEGISHTTFELRIRKLRAHKVLLGKTISLSLLHLGREAHKLLIYARGRTPELSTQLRAWAMKHPCISHYVSCLGHWDYELNAETRSARELATLSAELNAKFGDFIERIEPMTIVNIHRFSRFPL